MTMILLTSCFSSDKTETPEDDIVSNIVESIETDVEPSWEDIMENPEENEETPAVEIPEGESVVSGSENDPRVTNTTWEGTNPPETQSPSVPTEDASNPEEEEIIKDFEQELDSLFDLLESDEG